VLGDISVEEFGLLMANITAWVVPANARAPEQQGCNYCHNPGEHGELEREIYTKTVALQHVEDDTEHKRELARPM
jgi:hypothetical protein